jgi:Fic family protein
MKLVTKTINGIPYHYFQDNLHTHNGPKTISTFIGRADLDNGALKEAKGKAFLAHSYKIANVKNVITPGYHYEEMCDPIMADLIVNTRMAYDWAQALVKPAEWAEAEKLFYIRYVHGTTAIEGVALSEQETAKVLETGLTPLNKPILDVYAVNNFNQMKRYIKDYRGPINEKLTKEVQSILMYGMRNERGEPIGRGEYRDRNVILVGLTYRPPSAEQVPQKMRYLIAEYENGLNRGVHPVELASIFHQKFEEIHPFQDGNGRTGREILNLMLTRGGFPPIYITPESRSQYISALEKGNEGDFTSLIRFITYRMAATVTYIYSKTGVYDIITAKSITEDAKGTAEGESYRHTLDALKEFRDLESPP